MYILSKVKLVIRSNLYCWIHNTLFFNLTKWYHNSLYWGGGGQCNNWVKCGGAEGGMRKWPQLATFGCCSRNENEKTWSQKKESELTTQKKIKLFLQY